jgi:hypothetical protein
MFFDFYAVRMPYFADGSASMWANRGDARGCNTLAVTHPCAVSEKPAL